MAYTCPVEKQNSNDSSLHVAEEDCLGLLPGHPDGPRPTASPTWFEMEPNEYSDFGQDVSTAARSPLKANRSNLKGSPTDIDASGGWNMDVTKSNMSRLMQGFTFSVARELGTNQPVSDPSGATYPFTMGAGTLTFDPLPAEVDAKVVMPSAGTIVQISGMSNPLNNGLFVVEDVNAADLEVTFSASTPTVAEDQIETATIRVVGLSNVVDQEAISVVVDAGGLFRIANEGMFGSLNKLGVRGGTWLFFGGDRPETRLGTNVGYARIALDWDPNENVADENWVRFDLATFTPVNFTSPTTSEAQVFLPTTIANGRESDEIFRHSYTIRRGLGRDADGEQAEYLIGSVPNELTFNLSGQSLMNVDLTFVATDYDTKPGTDSFMTGKVIKARGEAAYNTSSNVYGVKLYIHDPTKANKAPLFGYLREATITINNGVTPDKAVGVMGAFDTSQGNFTVGGELSAYFTTVAAAAAIRNNADVGLYNILAADNAGFIADIPLLTLGGGRIEVVKDEAITIPLTVNAAQASSLETLNMSYFQYLPDVAMPK